ncbi:hypothetical protein Spock_225 [Bacillus phage Spock]|uniref:Uncharacterized protein n=1 Tax=Bacillus phage Spock TaxID=1406791 RepID=U5PX95_9CAUD|nr:hypothetical protein Spock_225 [Bacillus phage Spock]AGY48625.1 hypothetical protein Spock_225 [Bacillus phage Spock]
MERELFLNQSYQVAPGKTSVTSTPLTFVNYGRDDVLPRIDRIMEAYTANSKCFGFTNIKYWLTDYNVTRGEY